MLGFTDPFAEMDQLLSSFGGRWRGGIMPVDAYEKDGIYTLRFDLPGVEPNNVDLTVEGNVLTVTAESPTDDEERVTWLLRERPSGSHRREVRLGEHLDAGAIEANFDNGVLTVTIPMREEAKPHKVTISSSAPHEIAAGGSNQS
ncbi:MAG TPA: Hsp20/alpha crystallin family protein [Acidimicrobiia bacterium]|nr:Hsp20/alpha crystallin family protein [Acidimicrobiia bacterium]